MLPLTRGSATPCTLYPYPKGGVPFAYRTSATPLARTTNPLPATPYLRLGGDGQTQAANVLRGQLLQPGTWVFAAPPQVNHTQLSNARRAPSRAGLLWIEDGAPARRDWPSAKAAPGHLLEEAEYGRMYLLTYLLTYLLKAAPGHLLEEAEYGRMYACTRLAALQKAIVQRKHQARCARASRPMASPTTAAAPPQAQ